ncbi:MAG: PQQ-binding-like beta-propeller repeat protein [Synergistaceae bacterium]|nr:PQQ-binding-like beta-propeller repeat protein [Synergistaceae bacterium]
MKKIIFVFALIISFATPAFAFNGVRWQFDAPVTSNITVHENNLYFGDSIGFCYAVNKNSGSVIWSYNAGGSIIGTPAILDDKESKVLFVSSDGTITCLNLYDGSLIWDYKPRENRNEAVNDGTTAGDGLFFVVKDDAKLHALDVETGRRVWTYQGGDQGLRTAPAYSDGLIFLGEYDGVLNIIDAKTGERVNGGGAGGAVNTPAVNNGNVYFSSWDGSVQAVQVKSVIPLWSTNVKDPVTTSPAISGGLIAVGTGRGLVVVLDENNGNIIWNFDCQNGSVSSKPVIASGKVFACSEGGNVYELNARTGRLIDTFETDGINTNPAYSGGVFYFAAGGKVIALSE